MKDLILKFAGLVDKIGSLLNLNSTAGSIALAMGFIILAIVLCSLVFKFVKKVAGKGLAIVLVIAILISCGLLTLGQVRNFIEASGIIAKEGWATATEDGGSWFIHWMESLMGNDSTDVGGFNFNGGTWN